MSLSSYKFYREEIKQWEPVTPEYWQWEVTYADGSKLKQYDENGIYHQIQEIVLGQPFHFKLSSRYIGDRSYTLLVTPEMSIELLYRVCKDGENNLIGKICIFGFLKEGNGAYVCLLPNGQVIITDNKDSVNF